MNLQNIPRKDKTIKRGFLPKHGTFVFADYAAIEYRVLAYYLAMIGYPDMAADFRAGLDPHRQTAARLLGVETPNDEQRQFGKTLNFASIYGAGAGEIGEQLKAEGVSLPKGMTPKKVLDQFHMVNPGIRKLSWAKPKWEDPKWVPGEIEHRLNSVGHIKTLWGRELHPVPYKALNALIQGCSADLMRCSMVGVHDRLRTDPYFISTRMVMSVHDELIFDTVEEEVPLLAGALPGWMSNEKLTKVLPIEVEIEVSRKTWADKESYG